MTADPAALARTILTDIEAGIPQPRPLDWPTDDEIAYAADAWCDEDKVFLRRLRPRRWAR